MAELAQAPVAGEGTTAPAPEGTTPAAPDTDQGQANAQGSSAQDGQAAPAAPPAQPFDENFDPKTLPPELQAGYKQMHGAFTKRMQAISQDRELLDQAKRFVADPITGMQQMAQQYGYRLTRAEAAAELNRQNAPQPWDPRSGEAPPDWETVLSAAETRAEQRLMQKFGPVIGNVQKLQAQNIESQLDGLDPQWRSYEDSMRDNLKAHPTLVNDVATLYRLSVPQEVIEARATQAALSRLNKTTHSARVSGTSTTRTTVPATREVKTFADAVEAAREQLNTRK